MCGLLGFQFRRGACSESKQQVLAAVLAMHMDKRGGDSWGVYWPEHDELTHGIGQLADGMSAAHLASAPCMFAHTRKATTGKVTTDNAHPFRFASLVGAHNGMVSNHAQLNLWHGRDYPVDSMHIFGHLEDGAPLSEIKAYGAVQYTWRARAGRVYLGTFDGGELCVTKVRGGIVWASTARAVRQALALAGMSGRELDIKDGRRYFVEDGRCYLDSSGVLDLSPYWRPLSSRLSLFEDDFRAKTR